MCTLLVTTCATSASAQLPSGLGPFLSPALPEAIQDCVDAGVCTTPGTVSPFSPNEDFFRFFRHYRYTDFSSGTAISMELLQYAIGGASNDTTTNLDTGNAVRNETFSGVAWVAMQSEYDLSNDNHQMRLFFEQVSPAFLGFGEPSYAGQQTVDISLTTDALLAGSGALFFNVDGPDDRDRFSLDVSENAIIVCLAPGCYGGADFNLLNASFSQVGDTAVAAVPIFPVSIEGQLLFSKFTGFPGFDDSYDDPNDEIPAEEYRTNIFVGVSTLLGDCNQDGFVNFSDIASFIAILSNRDFLAEADINEDGEVDFLDISPFIAILGQ